jgi:hypothetical protein
MNKNIPIKGKIIRRNDLKNFRGWGNGIEPPAPPTDGVGCYKCCWIATPNICSAEVIVPNDAQCVPGAVLTPC